MNIIGIIYVAHLQQLTHKVIANFSQLDKID